MRKHVRRDILTKGCSVIAALSLTVGMVPSTALAAMSTSYGTNAQAQEQVQVASTESTAGAEAAATVQSIAEPAATATTGFGLTYVTNSTATTWDGATIDVSWYNTTDTVFHIKSAAQLIGLSAITSPLRGTFEEDLPTDASGNYVLTGVASNAVDANGKAINVDTFAGKTVYLDYDIDINGGTSTETSTVDWWKPIADCNVYSASAGGQGATISGSFDAVQWLGTFDGQGHTVKNLYDDGTNNDLLSNNFGGYQGMFTQIGVGGIIQNVGTTGYLKGRINGGICSQSAYVDYVKGASMQQWPRIQNCWSSVENVNNGSGSRMSGGIFGSKDSSSVYCNIINCYSSSDLSGGESRAGIAGAVNGVVAGCYFTGTITSGGSNYTGAIAGTLYKQGALCDGITDFGIGKYVNNYALTSSTSSNGYSYRYIEGSSTSAVGCTDGLVDEETLKAAASQLGDAYVADTEGVNNGYPILFCQAGLSTIDLSGATVEAIPDQQYTAKALTPDLTVTLNGETLTYGTDYLVDYANNISGDDDGNGQATVFGVGRYTGQLAAVNFKIEKTGLANTTISPIDNQWRYPGDEDSSVKPTLFVEDSEGNALTEGTDYQVTYTNNDAAGVATATITPAEGSMSTGSNSIEFIIVDASESLNGSGTAEDPYQIASKYDLQLLSHKVLCQDAAYLGANYVLTQDISTGRDSHQQNDPEVSPIGFNGYLLHDPSTGEALTGTTQRPFYGTFDGAGHTITLSMTDAAFDSLDLRETNPYANTYLGLFGVVGNADKTYTTETTIKNLTVDGSVLINAASVGAAGVVGYSYYGTLNMQNVTNKASVTTERDVTNLLGGATAVPTTSAAGICYEATIATFDNCVNEGTLDCNSTSYLAGILAYGYSSSSGDLLKAPLTFTNCANKGAITDTYATNGYAAGILGYSAGYSDITISKCSNTADIAAAGYPSGIMSGTGTGTFAKGNSLLIDQCYNTGNMTNTYAFGAAGILARTGNYTYTVSNCYNTGNVTAASNPGTYAYSTNAFAGGIVGNAYNSMTKTGVFTVENCYNVGTLSGMYYGDLTGQVANSTTTANRGTVILGGYGTSDKCYSFRATNTSAASEETLIAAGNIKSTWEQKTSDEMKGADVLAGLGETFKADGTDECSINNGYPVLAWQEIPEPEPATPEITTQPESTTAKAGDSVTMSVATKGEVTGYQWQHSKDGIKWNNTTWTGADSSELSFKMLAALDGRQWRCVVTFEDGTELTSDAATTSLQAAAGRITEQPASTFAYAGQTATMKVAAEATAEGVEVSGYQWQHSKDGKTWSNTAWSTTDELSFKMLTALADRQWRCVVTFTDGTSVTSDTATSYLLAQPEAILAEAATAAGEDVGLSVLPIEGATYQWQHSKDGKTWNNTKWAGYDDNNFSFKMLTALDGRQWRCKITLDDGFVVYSTVATTKLAE